MAKPQSLFRLYEADKLPTDSGFIVTSYYDPQGTVYTILELISYANVKEIVSDGQSLTFRSDGLKLYILIEPANYYQRQTEPVFRDTGKSIPYRFSELEVFKDIKNNRVMVGKQTIVSLSSFSVDSPAGDNFSVFITRDLEVHKVMKEFITDVINKDTNIPRDTARKVANYATEIMVRTVKL
jgi:hypothetical protein